MERHHVVIATRSTLHRPSYLTFVGGSLAGTAALASGGALAQSAEVTALMVNAMLGPALKPIAGTGREGDDQGRLLPVRQRHVLASDAPGGARYDLMNSSFAFSQPV